MMLDEDLVAASPSTVYRVLRAAGRLDRFKGKPSRKGKGFARPLGPHAHWHVDIAYINVGGTFYYLCTVLDGYSRVIAHWELREAMTEADVELVIQRARELVPGAKPRIITDNGPQFVARDFRQFVRICGMTHVRTSPGYPQSNGKLERWHRTLKASAIRPRCPADADEARRLIDDFVDHYNNRRLHSAWVEAADAQTTACRLQSTSRAPASWREALGSTLTSRPSSLRWRAFRRPGPVSMAAGTRSSSNPPRADSAG